MISSAPSRKPDQSSITPSAEPTLLDAIAMAARAKANLDVQPLLIKASMAGALLGLATCLSYLAMEGLPEGRARLMAGAVFPVGFMVIMLMRLELIAGNFTVLSMGCLHGCVPLRLLLRNWSWVYLGNAMGALLVGVLLSVVLTNGFQTQGGWLVSEIVKMTQMKTLSYQQGGWLGWTCVFIKAVLCNWLVALAVVLGIVIPSVPGKIMAAWLPLMNFMALGFEHAVVNLFVTPTGILLGAGISLDQWLLWNFLPVTLGNLLGGIMISYALFFGYGTPTKR